MKIIWLTPYSIDKLWDPALRLRRWNVHAEFLRMGIDSKFLFDALTYSDAELFNITSQYDVIIFTEQSQREYELILKLKQLGKFIVRDHCELLFGFPWQEQSFRNSDLIICSSSAIQFNTAANKYAGLESTQIIADMWERAELCKLSNKTDNLRAVFMGTANALAMASGDIGNLVKECGYELILISNDPNVGILWNKDTWRSIYSGCDIAICPQDPSQFPGKSSVKVAQAIGCGYPTIASDIGSYSTILRNGVGIIAHNMDEWRKALLDLKDPDLRYKYHLSAVYHSNYYSPESIAKQWYYAIMSYKKSLETI
jgi:glycosyltransferase involved in cell wall biosynthesis